MPTRGSRHDQNLAVSPGSSPSPGACGAAFLAMLALLYWLRARQLAMQFHRTLHARVQERTRIARDLHDTLLQSFQGVLLQFGAGLRLLAREPQKAREVLGLGV